MHTLSRRHLQFVQLAASLGFVVVLLDVSVVNVALKALRAEFNASVTGLQWVINAYALVFAALLLSAGALGDRFGAKRVFMGGFAIFTLGSVACGVAPSLGLLIVARAVQGVGAALLVPTSLSVIRHVFLDDEARSRAIGWWGAGGGIALAAGPVVGGLLIASLGWRSIFLLNLPIGLVGLWMVGRYAPPSRRQPERKLDIAGQTSGALALACLTFALTQASESGWASLPVVGAAMLFVVSGAVFLWLEARNPAAMLPLSLFRDAILSGATIVGIVCNLVFYGMVFVLSLYFQSIRHFSPEATGLAFLPMMAILMVMNLVAARLMTRLGPRPLTTVGLTVSAFGYLLLLPAASHGAFGWLVLPMLIAGAGVALTIPTITHATLSAVPHAQAGIASGLLNAARQVGGVIGVAVFGFLVRDPAPARFMHGMHVALLVSVGLLMSGAWVGFTTMKPRRETACMAAS